MFPTDGPLCSFVSHLRQAVRPPRSVSIEVLLGVPGRARTHTRGGAAYGHYLLMKMVSVSQVQRANVARSYARDGSSGGAEPRPPAPIDRR